MDREFLMLCHSLNSTVITPLLHPANREDTLRDFGSLGLDILQRWESELKDQA